MTALFTLDIEASGLAPESYPIEIAVAGHSGVRRWLIRPEPHWHHWDESAEQLHGYSREALERGGAAHQVAAELNAHLDGSEVYTDALEWDRFWLVRLFEASVEMPSFRLCRAEAECPPEFGLHRAALHAQRLFEALTVRRRRLEDVTVPPKVWCV